MRAMGWRGKIWRSEQLRKRLVAAAAAGSHSDVVALLNEGVDPEGTRTRLGRLFSRRAFSPLVAACREGHGDVAETLLRRGADPNRRDETGTTPIAAASLSGNLSTVKLLLQRGADPRLDPWAIHYAAIRCHRDVLGELLRAGADARELLGRSVESLQRLRPEVLKDLIDAVGECRLELRSLLVERGE
jgi:hypothetical protein